MENGYRVMKFGGASVGTSERLLRALDLIAREWKSSPLAVVVSAMGDTTDWLIEAARSAAAGDAQGARAIAQRAADLAATNGERALESLRHSAPATSNESSGERVKREVEEAVAPASASRRPRCSTRWSRSESG
jgi:aspartokinase/homoserine dehydrogenase 1